MSLQGNVNINDLFQTAEDDGTISPGASAVFELNDIGQQIQDGLCPQIEDIEASSVTLFAMMPDDSGSIRVAGNSQLMRDGHNLVLDSLEKSKTRNNILVHNKYLNGRVLYPFGLLDQAVRMTSKNYNPNEGTPLYDQTVVLLGTVLAEVQRFENTGIQARAVTLIITDGADEHSVRSNAADVKKIVNDLLRTENHIIAGMGIDNGYTDFRQVFAEMGILPEWILTPGNSPQELRAAFELYSQSAVQASQHSGNYSNYGGFTN